MARGFSNALRLALSAASGAAEGYGAKQERVAKEEALKAAQARQAEQDALARFKLLADLDFRPDFGEEPEPAMPVARPTSRIDTTLPTFGAGLAPAMERTRRESFGITPETPVAQPKPLVSALTQAEQMQPPRPRTDGLTINVPGVGSMRMRRPYTPEEKADLALQAYRKQREVDVDIEGQKAQAEQKATEATANSLADLMVRTYRTPDGKPLTRDAALYAAQSGKTPIELGLVERSMTEAERKRLSLDWARLSLDREKAANTGEVGDKEKSAMQQMMLARVNVARQQAQAANAEMEKFEAQLIDGTQKIGAIEAQLANEMFKDTRFNRLAEARLNKMNPELAMYVRNAKAIGAAERLVMPRGGSNSLMNIETALAGVGPGASPELIRNTQAFRRGLVEGVQKETPEALMEAENARLESAIGSDTERRGVSQPTAPTGRPPLSSFKR